MTPDRRRRPVPFLAAVSSAATVTGSALILAAVTTLASVPEWTTEAGIALMVSGVIGLVLPAVLPARLVRVRYAGGVPPTFPRTSSSLAPGGRAPTGGEGTL